MIEKKSANTSYSNASSCKPKPGNDSLTRASSWTSTRLGCDKIELVELKFDAPGKDATIPKTKSSPIIAFKK